MSAPARALPVELEVDSYHVIVRAGELRGAWLLATSSLEPLEANRFRLRLGPETFLLIADDPVSVARNLIPRFEWARDFGLSGRRQPGRRRFDTVGDPADAVAQLRAALEGLGGGAAPVAGTETGTEKRAAAPAVRRGATPARIGRRRRAKHMAPARHRLADSDLELSYVDVGDGPPVVFLHGGVMSTQLWSDVLPVAGRRSRCVALDLMGIGASSRLPPDEPYTWDRQVDFLDDLLTGVGITGQIALVMHGWGTLVGLTWARRHARRVRAICNIESLMAPLDVCELGGWLYDMTKEAEWPPGDDPVESPTFFDDALAALSAARPPASSIAQLRADHRSDPDSCRAIRSMLRSLPLGDERSSNHELIESGARWLDQSDVPKLLVLGRPGYLLEGRRVEPMLRFSNQTVATVEGKHLLPLEAPGAVGRFLTMWLSRLG